MKPDTLAPEQARALPKDRGKRPAKKDAPAIPAPAPAQETPKEVKESE